MIRKVSHVIGPALALTIAAGLPAGCNAPAQQRDYPVPFVGSRVPARPERTMAKAMVAPAKAISVGRNQSQTGVDRYRTRPTAVGTDRYQPMAGRKRSSPTAMGSQRAVRKSGVGHASRSLIGHVPSTTGVGTGGSTEKLAGTFRIP